MIAFAHVWLRLGDRLVLKDVSFEVRPGETRVILGGSGSGKTTLLRLALGLYRPDKGSITVAGQDIAGLPERDLFQVRRQMAMVFQDAALFDSLSVRENVGYRLWEEGLLSDEQIEEKAIESLRFVGLDDILDKMPAELSGGMRKRVGIARALASGAKTLLYDEPTAGLDPINTCVIGRLILRLKAMGVTQVVVTHDLETAYRIADRMILIVKGRLAFDGTPEELHGCEQPEIREFLDPGSMPSEWKPLPKPDSPVGEPSIQPTAASRSAS